MKIIRLLVALGITILTIRLGYAQTPQPVLRLNSEVHNGMIRRISTDSLGKYILTCSDDKTAKLWDATNGRLLRTFRPPIEAGASGGLYACAISPDGKILSLGGEGLNIKINQDIYIFNTNTGELLQHIAESEHAIYDLEFSMDGKYLAVAMESGGVQIFEWIPGQKFEFVKTLPGYEDGCYNVAFDHSGRLATVCDDSRLRLYDRKFNEIAVIRTKGGTTPYSIAFSPCGSKIAIGFYDKPVVEIYDGNTLKLLYKPDISGSNEISGSYGIAFTNDGKYLLGSYQKKEDGLWVYRIRRWEKAGKGHFTDFTVCQSTVTDIKPMTDNSFIFCGIFPDFGRMKPEGTFIFYKSAETNDFSYDDKSHLKVNDDGYEIGFTPLGKSSLFFSAKNKDLTGNPSQYKALSSNTDHFGGILLTDWRDESRLKLNGKILNFMEPDEISRSVDISRDTASIIVGASWDIYCLNSVGELKWKTFSPAIVYAVKIANNNQIVVAAMSNGTINWYRMSDGALLLSLFAHPDNNKWVLYTPCGYYINTKGGDELIGWQINNSSEEAANFYPAKNYADRFFRPDIISHILESCKTDLEILKSTNEETKDNTKLPPLIKVTSPVSESNDSQISINLAVTDQGGGIDEVLLYFNGKLAETFKPSLNYGIQKNSTTTLTFTVSLIHGVNNIKATAFNNYRTEAIEDEVSITYNGKETIPNLYILAIGINEYKNPRYKLNYAVSDAMSFIDEMKKGTKDIFGKVETIFIKDTLATRASILKIFDELKLQLNPEDVFVFFYAGHGVMSEGKNSQFYIVPSEVTQLLNTNEEMQKVAINSSELKFFSKNLKAQKQLFIFDACHSGGMVDLLVSRGSEEERAIAQLARSTGTYWIAASGSQELATEFKMLGHGLFTYTILQGFQGDADGSHDKQITVEELSTYIKNKLPEFSKQHHGQVQYPYSFGYGMDFPIFILK